MGIYSGVWKLCLSFVANNKLAEINLHLKTEYYHLSSPAKVERHAKDILQMVEITEVTNINYEK